MAITAKQVNELRSKTGAGIMDCKKALQEANGDFGKSIEILRKRGQKISLKRSGREATEGSVFTITSNDLSVGIIIALSCETDFVAKNETFEELGKLIVESALKELPNTKEDLINASTNNKTIQDHITEYIGKIGEKIEIKTYEKIKAPLVVQYIHTGKNLGVLVGLNDKALENKNESSTAGQNVAMQIAAMNPVALAKENISEDIKEKELEIAKQLARNEGKPEPVVEKIAQGKLEKYFKDNTLLSQPYIKDNSLSVEKYLNSIVGGLTVVDYKRVSIK